MSDWVTDKYEDVVKDLDNKYSETLKKTDKFIKKDTSFGYTDVKYLDCDVKISKMYQRAEKCYKKAKTGFISEVEFDKMKKFLDPYKIEEMEDKVKTNTIRACYNDALGHRKDLTFLISRKRLLDSKLNDAIESANKTLEKKREEDGYDKHVNKVGELINVYQSLYQYVLKFAVKEYSSCLSALDKEVNKYELKNADKKK